MKYIRQPTRLSSISTMNALEFQAMLIRYEVALRQAHRCGINERIELLWSVLTPGPDLLKASLKQAEIVGPSQIAKRCCTRTQRPQMFFTQAPAS